VEGGEERGFYQDLPQAALTKTKGDRQKKKKRYVPSDAATSPAPL
jgi:hypothetical protein